MGKANRSSGDLVRRDRALVWHPYASMIDPPPVFPVVSASGVRIRLADGTELIDGMASWWSAIHGYNHPGLNRAVTQQLESMSHVMFGGLTHEPAVRLAERLVELTPQPLQAVFFADSGSVSVEVAIKIAIQFQQARGLPNRQKLLTIRGGYHGDTLGAMAVSDPVTGMHTLFNGVLSTHYFADRPAVRFGAEWNARDTDSLEALFAEHSAEIAAVILEPIVQGAGGMWFYHPEYLRRARELCDEHRVLLIADEIATGFGRSGKLFACEYAGITPDILCLGKGIDRRLHDPGRDACHTSGRGHYLAGRPRRLHAWPHLHGQSAGLRGRIGQYRAAFVYRVAIPSSRNRGANAYRA